MKPEILIEYFEGLDYDVVSKDTHKGFTYSPDLVFEKDSVIKAIAIREKSDSISEALVHRYAASKRIRSKTLELYFSFSSKPTMSVLATCKSFGVGILYLNKDGQVEIYAESKKILGRKKINAIPKTQIFFCSQQILDERTESLVLINDLRDSLSVPLFGKLVENDQQYSSDIRKLWPIIERCMDECEYFLVILSGAHRPIVERECRRALAMYDPDEILFYVKSDVNTKDSWQALLIDATIAGVKFQEFFDLRDYRLKLNARLIKITKQLHEDHDVPFLTSDL